ncbi:MAG TPA: GAF domain-containing sensor histidine kinase, partial [Aggregatilineales bacterium]|nr:GAF domain-containing sensor histidine kinase [Aggregatilineales bacterium]
EVASQRLITRHIDEPIVLDNRDELAQVVISFNNLAREMISARDRALEQHTLTEALLDSAMAISSTLNLAEVVTQILDNLRRVMQYDVANIMIREEDRVLVLCERRYSREGSVTLLGERSFSATDEHYPGSSGSSAMPMIGGNSADGIRFKPFVDSSGLNSYLFLPIVLGQSVIGYINLGSEMPSYFDEQHTAYLQIFALQAGSAIQNAQLYKQARSLATLEERQRLARELHDSVSQILFSTNVMAEALPRLMDQNASSTRDYLYDLQELTHSAMLEMKSLLVELRIESLLQTDLGVLLNRLADSFTGKTQVKVEKAIQRQVILPPQTQVVFYRVAQEAFSNIVRHAQAGHVKLSLQLVDKVCSLHIEDDGSGFDPEAVSEKCLGLRIMKERANEIQASLVVQTATGQGARIALIKHLE